jgi:peptide chain release factor 2
VSPFDVAGLTQRLDQINKTTEEGGFWDDHEKAQKLLKEKKSVESNIEEYEEIKKEFEDLGILIDLAQEEEDQSMVPEIQKAYEDYKNKYEDLRIKTLLNGEYDGNNAIISIHAGSGGTDAQDWAEMLLRMYTRWSESKGYKVKILDYQDATEGGIKSATLLIEGENAYGYLKAENGVHRLVRISPFDANARRQTSFASVTVYPEVDDDIVIDIPEKDVRVDVYRASGAGGQKVNKTSSAVRLTHLPSGITVAMQNERSQHANRDMAWKILRSRLHDLEMQKRNQARDEAESQKKDIAFGSQIRSYVLAPYRLVKDLRTGVETGNVDAVLDGKLDDFVTAQLLGVKNPNRAVPE